MGRRGTIALVAGTEQTRKTLVEQLESYLGDVVEVKSYAIDEGVEETIRADLVILSTHLIEEEAWALIDPDCSIITGRRAINYSRIDPIFFIPPGTDVLLVNDVRETTQEAIESLQALGIDHLNFIPFYPGIQSVKRARIAITLGEISRVPGFVEEVIDIGPRLMDMATLTEILKRLNILDEQGGAVTTRYLQKIFELGKKLARSTNEIGELNIYLKRVLDSLNDGILAFTPDGEVNVCNENVKEILKIENFKTQGRHLRSLIRHDKLLAFLLGDSDEEHQLFRINGQDLVVQRMVNTKDSSIIATFKNASATIELEKKLRSELVKKGYVGKYTFADIVGESPQIVQLKEIAGKLARTDAAVLIEGESGTGKELCASAIHNASPRRTGPFLAVNFSALPDNLVESELFGYEEGAFTGAKKGGKAGLFEQASGGTIFLDEIGDISIKVQARLLRVLQEKEVMRVGGTRIIPIDVRVVAATNRNLAELIQKGEFREDLYHRLKVLYLKLPPLRERKMDIPLLIQHFLRVKGGSEIEIDPNVYQQLAQYAWYGNVRELENTIDYMLAVAEDARISLEDLPADSFFQYQPCTGDEPELVEECELEGNALGRREAAFISEEGSFDGQVRMNGVSDEQGRNSAVLIGQTEEYRFILQSIHELTSRGEIAGRQRLAELSASAGLNLSENQIRHRLNELENHGLLLKQRGKFGTRLTVQGLQVLQEIC